MVGGVAMPARPMPHSHRQGVPALPIAGSPRRPAQRTACPSIVVRCRSLLVYVEGSVVAPGRRNDGSIDPVPGSGPVCRRVERSCALSRLRDESVPPPGAGLPDHYLSDRSSPPDRCAWNWSTRPVVSVLRSILSAGDSPRPLPEERVERRGERWSSSSCAGRIACQ